MSGQTLDSRSRLDHDNVGTGSHQSREDFGAPRVRVIDGFELRIGAVAVDVPRSCQRLVAFLALWDRPVLRSFVSGSLWPESDSDHANACLRSTLWRLPAGEAAIVVAKRGHVALDSRVSVDYREAVRWSQLVISQEVESLATAWSVGEVGPLAGDLLPDWYDDWALLARERFRQMRLHALEALCEQLAARGRFAEALVAGLGAVAIEPLRETAHRRVIAVHLLEGNHIEALRQYGTYERLLMDELGLRPSPVLTSMVHG